MSKKIIAVIGARPQFIKHAPIDLMFKEHTQNLSLISIHTGQHYDQNMSAVFFNQLNISTPDYMLNIGSHPHGKQTGIMLETIEEILIKERPDAVLVYGDTNSTLAGALAACKMHIPVFHIEAGLRSFNREMPEEVNRVVTDHVSQLLFVPTDRGVQNLANEGITNGVYETGDIMYDMLLIAKKSGVIKKDKREYYLATIHRPYNTDIKDRLMKILSALNELDLPVKCPFHPRVLNLLKKFDIDLTAFPNIKAIQAVSYFENINLMANAKSVITDSGGMQKEAYWLRKKCVTIRPETEWVETIQGGWNTLIFKNLSELQELLHKSTSIHIPDIYGAGKSRIEIFNHIENFLC